MKILIILTLTLFSSCKPPKIPNQERCAVSLKFNKCRCIEYNLNDAEPVGTGYDREIEHCDDLVGFSKESWGEEISPWATESIQYYNDSCK